MSTTKRDQAIEHFASSLSDYEFELLVRKRISNVRCAAVAELAAMGIIISDYYQTVMFYSSGETCQWTVTLGVSYEKKNEEAGEVLSMTMDNAVAGYKRKHSNKLDLLLAAPELVMNNQDDPGDADEKALAADSIPF